MPGPDLWPMKGRLPIAQNRLYSQISERIEQELHSLHIRTHDSMMLSLDRLKNQTTMQLLANLETEMDGLWFWEPEKRARFQRGLRSALGNWRGEMDTHVKSAMREAGMLSDERMLTSWRKIYAGSVPVSIATELEELFSGQRTFYMAMQGIGAAEYRGTALVSGKIWDFARGAEAHINDIVTRGVAVGLDATQLSKAIEDYLVPDGELPLWGGSKLEKRLWSTPGAARKAGFRRAPKRLRGLISSARAGSRTMKGTVSHNAFRLARTEIQRSFRTMHVIRTMQMERAGVGFTHGIKWNLSASHPEPDICNQWASQNIYNLGAGVYPPDSVPFDHPNGLCFTTDALMSVPDFKAKVRRLLDGKTEQQVNAGIRDAGTAKAVSQTLKKANLAPVPKTDYERIRHLAKMESWSPTKLKKKLREAAKATQAKQQEWFTQNTGLTLHFDGHARHKIRRRISMQDYRAGKSPWKQQKTPGVDYFRKGTRYTPEVYEDAVEQLMLEYARLAAMDPHFIRQNTVMGKDVFLMGKRCSGHTQYKTPIGFNMAGDRIEHAMDVLIAQARNFESHSLGTKGGHYVSAASYIRRHAAHELCHTVDDQLWGYSLARSRAAYGAAQRFTYKESRQLLPWAPDVSAGQAKRMRDTLMKMGQVEQGWKVDPKLGGYAQIYAEEKPLTWYGAGYYNRGAWSTQGGAIEDMCDHFALYLGPEWQILRDEAPKRFAWLKKHVFGGREPTEL